MNKQYIERYLKEKVEDFTKELGITTDMQRKVKNNVVVAGGSIRSLLSGEEPNDIDIYFKDQKLLFEVVRQVIDDNYVEASVLLGNPNEDDGSYDVDDGWINNGSNGVYVWLQSMGVWEPDDEPDPEKQEVAFITGNAITFSNGFQLVTRFTGSEEEILSTFDFAHTTNYYSIQKGLVLNDEALVAILNKQLVYVGSKYPLASLMRIKKFEKIGYSIPTSELLKIAFNLNDFDLTDEAVLADQLTGVDVSYTGELVREVKSYGKDIDTGYLMKLASEIYVE